MESAMDSIRIREVWDDNFDEEMVIFAFTLHFYPVISIDTEFPGFLRNIRRDASEALCYDNMKFNVDHLKLIQLGLTLSNSEGKIGACWQFNFCDFDPETDLHVTSSIDLLRKNGLDLEKMKREGVYTAKFAEKFAKISSEHRELKWVTFHGLYDLAYLMRVMTGGKLLPESASVFLGIAREVFRHFYDIKFMARYCNGLLGGEVGLDRMAKILKVERCCGQAHQAGSDSLLTSCVFSEMKAKYEVDEDMYDGILYGITPPIRILSSPPQQYYILPSGRSFHYSQLKPSYCVSSYYYVPMYTF